MSVLFISSHHFCGHPPWRLSVLFCRRLCASLCVFLGLSGPLCASLCFSQALWASLGLSGTLRASLGLCRPLWASLGLSNKNKTIHNLHTAGDPVFLGARSCQTKRPHNMSPTAGAPVSFEARNCKTKRPDNTRQLEPQRSSRPEIARQQNQTIHTRQLEPQCPSRLSGPQPASQPAPQPASQAHDRFVLSKLGFSGPFYVNWPLVTNLNS